METKHHLNLLNFPAFTVRDGAITACNQAAAALNLEVGQKASFCADEVPAGGCLWCSIRLGERDFGATVTKADGEALYLLDAQSDDALVALSLAAKELRGPISAMMSSLESLRGKPEMQDTAASMERSLNRMLRTVCNMSDAGTLPSPNRRQVRELGSFVGEIVEKTAALSQSSGVTLTFSGLNAPVYSLCDEDLLQRAILNILGNALKFTPAGGTVTAELLRHGQLLQLRVTDSGSGIAEELRSSLFRRYLRQPAIEEGRIGLGLGLVMVRSAATAHGGTVLIDHPEGFGTRVTLTLKIKQDTGKLRSDIYRVNYAGELDSTLLELSDVLPTDCYKR